MARIRPAKGQPAGPQDPKLPGPAQPRRKERAPRRPVPQAPRTEKRGSFTKAVRTGKLSRFFGEVVVELRKVSWPNRPQLLQATAVVLVAVAIVAVYFAVLDFLFRRLVDAVF